MYSIQRRIAMVMALTGGTLLLICSTAMAQPDPRVSSNDTTRSSSISMSANGMVTEPDPDEVIEGATEPTFDMEDLQRRVRYPEEARLRKIEETIILRVLIDQGGHPVRSLVDYGNSQLLIDAARSAVMETRFVPGMQNGKPIAVWVSIPLTFKLK
jgi:TonB family protein